MKSLVVFLSLFVLTTGYTVGSRTEHSQVCDVCISTLEAVKSATTSDEIEKLVTDIATTVCSVVPSAQINCIKFVEYVVRSNFEIIRSFTALWTPEDICKIVRLCPQDEVLESGDGKVCTICTDILSVLRQILTDPTQKTMVKTYLETLCKVTGALETMCLATVDELTEESFLFIQHIFSKFDDKQLCSELHLCSKQSRTELMAYQELFMRRSDVSNSKICDACTATIQELEDILASETEDIVANIEDITGLLCSLIPIEGTRKECIQITQNLVEEFFYNVKDFMKKYDGKKICQLAHLCKAGTGIGNNTTPCDVCKEGFDVVKKVVTNPTVRKLFEEEVELVCLSFGPLMKICRTEISKVFEAIYKVIDGWFDVTALDFCIKIDLCKNQTLFLA